MLQLGGRPTIKGRNYRYYYWPVREQRVVVGKNCSGERGRASTILFGDNSRGSSLLPPSAE